MAWRRAVETNYRVRWSGLAAAGDTPADHDRTLAQQIRAYYRGKLVLRALRHKQPLTKFQQALYDMLEHDQYQNQHIGMLYRLPYFYAEDTAHENLRAQCPSVDVLSKRLHRQLEQRDVYELTPLQQVLRSRRQGETMEYWFRNARGEAVVWFVSFRNPLRSMVDALWRRGPVEISACLSVRTGTAQPGDDWAHYCIDEPELP